MSSLASKKNQTLHLFTPGSHFSSSTRSPDSDYSQLVINDMIYITRFKMKLEKSHLTHLNGLLYGYLSCKLKLLQWQ